VRDLFKGEKTTVFWIGLVIFGVSIYEFGTAIWQILYFYFLYPSIFGYTTLLNSVRLEALTSVPSFVGGIVFVLIGTYMMKVGVKKGQSIPQPSEQVQKTTQIAENGSG
jgi:hypothetical protein